MTDHIIDLGQLLASLRRQQFSIVFATAERQANQAMEDIVRHAPDRFVDTIELASHGDLQTFLSAVNFDPPGSAQTTRQMAVQAFRRALEQSRHGKVQAVGIAISQFTQTGGHVVVHSRQTTTQCSWQTSNRSSLIGPLRELLLNLLAQQVDRTAARGIVLPGELQTTWQHAQAHHQWLDLIHGQSRYLGDPPPRPVLFPGSFNPLHHGHRRIVDHAASRLGCRVHLEISVTNADKPELDYLTIKQRAGRAEQLAPVILTRAPRFVDKSQLFPGATFLIGADTALRLDDARFYGGSEAAKEAAIEKIADHDCRFLVFGRLIGQSFHDGDRLRLSPRLSSLCEFVPTIDFRVDVSSRQIRRCQPPGTEP